MYAVWLHAKRVLALVIDSLHLCGYLRCHVRGSSNSSSCYTIYMVAFVAQEGSIVVTVVQGTECFSGTVGLD